MLTNIRDHYRNYFQQLRGMDLLNFNKFIFTHLILHLFKTENILPFIIATCSIGFSIILQESRFLFIPQTSVAAYASFFIFTIIFSIITLVIYPVIIIFIVNFFTSYLKDDSNFKFWIKFCLLLISFTVGAFIFIPEGISLSFKIQLILIWLGIYYSLVGLYLTHLKHQALSKLSKRLIMFILIVAIAMSRPLMLIFLHTTEALNFTNVNTQVYLDTHDCSLLHDLDGKNPITPDNSTFNNTDYFQVLPNNQGCYIYGNSIRYSFAYDFVLLVKMNIHPLIGKEGTRYNQYVRLSCYAGNCYSEANIFFKDKTDIYADFIKNGSKFDRPL